MEFDLHKLLQFQQMNRMHSMQSISSQKPIIKSYVLNTGDGNKNIHSKIDIMKDFINTKINKNEEIDPEEVSVKYIDILKAIDTFNKTKQNWYDEKYSDDKAKFYQSLENDMITLKQFQVLDMINVN